jgi:DNA-binding MarR family transcriptional regulator
MNEKLYNSRLEEGLSTLQCELVAERNRVNPENISWFQYDLLELLYRAKGSLPSELSIKLGASRSKISKALKGLKEIDYIEQKKQPNDDAREFCTELTDSGFEFLKNTKSGHEYLAGIAETTLTKDEQVLFAEMCIKLSKAFEEKRKYYDRRND